MSFAPAYPHDAPEEIVEDVFMVRGSIPLNPIMRISRNMAIVRHERELTLINPIRLNDAGEAQLRELGEVKRIMRLGAFHGVDDPYYMETFGTEFWCQPGGEAYPEPSIRVELTEHTELPFPNATLFCFQGLLQPESILLVDKGDGLLLTCDAIQHYGDYLHNTLLAKLIMPFIGFPKTTIIGPIWLKLMTPEGASLESEFTRLLELPFDGLLSAHGSFLPIGAHQAVEAAFKKIFSN
ncbi:MAG: hypothetical protein O7C67_05950 [Gammaproteobacteria bacterium]|nr:hypothetical protein [Gammaproteobacteria bacterium]